VICCPEVDKVVEAHRGLSAAREEMYEPDEKFRRVAEHYWNWWHDVTEDTAPSYVMLGPGSMADRSPRSAMRYDRFGDVLLSSSVIEAWKHASSRRNTKMKTPNAAEMAASREHLLHCIGYPNI
jgi:hypothetical protein